MRRIYCIACFALAMSCGDEGAPGSPSAGGPGGEGAPNQAPIAVFKATPPGGAAPLMVTLDAGASVDPDGEIVSYRWSFAGGTGDGALITRSFDAGCHDVELSVTDDKGATGTAKGTVVVTSEAPQGFPVVTVDAAPIESAVLPRDVATNQGLASFHGVLESGGFTEIRAELVAGGAVRSTLSMPLCSPAPHEFKFDVPVPSELTAFDVRILVAGGADEHEVYRVNDLVAGDLYIIEGQSNAASKQQAGDANENKTPFVRSFGIRTDDGAVTDSDRAWRVAEGNVSTGPGGVGQWPIRLGAQLAAKYKIPIGILNGARAGENIAYFQRNDANPADLATNYGRLLTRARNAGIDGSLRAILWYQGEADGSKSQAHHDGFVALKADWAEDYPSVERVYVTQIRPGCGVELLGTQEVQRKLPDEFPDITVMSTTGLDGHDGCHFYYEEGYRELGDRYAALLGRDLYGDEPATDVQPPNPASARFTSGGTEVVIEMRNAGSALTFEAGAEADFKLVGSAVQVVSGAAAGNQIILKLSGKGSAATGISYLGHIGAGPWVVNENGIGLLEFKSLPIQAE